MDYNITYREKQGGIQVIVSYKTNDGKWRQRSKQGFNLKSGKKLAKLAAEKMIDELKQNEFFDHDNNELTLRELREDYLEHIRIHREYNTHQNYLTCFKHYTQLDNIVISKLKVIDVQKCVNIMVDKGLAHNTLDRFTTIFKSFLKWCDSQYNVKVPKMTALTIPAKKTSTEKEVKAIESNKLEDILFHFKLRKHSSLDYYICVLIASKAGLRIGEISGLTWDDVDFDNNKINVNKQWKKDKKSKLWGFGDLKSVNSYRTVPITDLLCTELRSIKNISPINLHRRLISADSTQSLTVNLDRVLKRKYDITIHILRHTYATNLISRGLNFKTSAKILGHDVEQTMKTYSHVTDEMMKEAETFIKTHMN